MKEDEKEHQRNRDGGNVLNWGVNKMRLLLRLEKSIVACDWDSDGR